MADGNARSGVELPFVVAATESPPRPSIAGALVGTLVAHDLDGLVVDFPGNADGPVRARLGLPLDAAQLARALADRSGVVLMFEHGDPARPIEVPSASVIEVRALTHRCLACDGELRVHEHRAAHDLREVELACKRCGRRRVLWLRVSLPS